MELFPRLLFQSEVTQVTSQSFPMDPLFFRNSWSINWLRNLKFMGVLFIIEFMGVKNTCLNRFGLFCC